MRKGETLWGIAWRYGVALTALIAANPQIKNPNLIYPGDQGEDTMRGRIITSDHRIFELPVLLRWNITYTGGVPCDSYEGHLRVRQDHGELLHLAAGFWRWTRTAGLLRGIVDEYEVKLTAAGLAVTICGRGYAARLLDNESRPVTYQGATLAEIVRCHAAPYGISSAGDRAGVGGLCLHRGRRHQSVEGVGGFLPDL